MDALVRKKVKKSVMAAPKSCRSGNRIFAIRSDPLATLGYLFLGQFPITCLDAADANDDGNVDIADAIATLDFLFLGGSPLRRRTCSPGGDPTPDDLGCFAPTE